MTLYDRLAEAAQRAALREEGSGYFSEPEATLDPKLFTANEVLKPSVRAKILGAVYGFWQDRYRDAQSWSRVYLAGSGVSYQWSAARSPGDLDGLIGVDWVGFRRSNPDFRDLGDDELASYLNQELHDDLWPQTANFLGAYEFTTYINVGGYDIRAINPYAAYDVSANAWVVKPDPHAHPVQDPRWEALAAQDLTAAQDIISSYNNAYDQVQGTSNPGLRLNAEITLRTTAARGAHMFDAIHAGRHKAFAPGGLGFNDFNEYRYKSAKAHGIMSALREMKVELQEAGLANERGTYGVELPDAQRTLVAAALTRRYNHGQ